MCHSRQIAEALEAAHVSGLTLAVADRTTPRQRELRFEIAMPPDTADRAFAIAQAGPIN